MSEELEVFVKDDTYYMSDITKTAFNEFIKTLSKNTAGHYRLNVGQFLSFVEKDFLECTEEDARDYIDSLYAKKEKGYLKIGTLKAKLSSLAGFENFLIEHKIKEESIFENIKRPFIEKQARVYKIPTYEELDKILESTKTGPEYLYPIACIIARMGIKPGAVIKLQSKDVVADMNNPYIVVQGNNKNPARTVPIPKDLLPIFIKLLDEAYCNSLFYNKHGKPLTQRVLEYSFQKAVKEVSLEYTLNNLRDRALIDMLQSGAKEDEVSEYTGTGLTRLHAYKGIGVMPCPADLVNIKIKS